MTRNKSHVARTFMHRPKLSAYERGYGKPPQETCFKPGQSGNPGGRPKGAKNKSPSLSGERLRDIIFKEAYRVVPVHDGVQNVTVPMAQAIVRALTVAAVKGDARAQRLFTGLLHTTEREKAEQEYALLDVVIGYKVAWEKELAHRARMGIEGPEPFPHPDQIIVDLRGGNGVTIKGPMTRQEKTEIDQEIDGQRRLKGQVEIFLKDAKAEMARARSAKTRKSLKDRICSTESVLNKVSICLSDLEY